MIGYGANDYGRANYGVQSYVEGAVVISAASSVSPTGSVQRNGETIIDAVSTVSTSAGVIRGGAVLIEGV